MTPEEEELFKQLRQELLDLKRDKDDLAKKVSDMNKSSNQSDPQPTSSQKSPSQGHGMSHNSSLIDVDDDDLAEDDDRESCYSNQHTGSSRTPRLSTLQIDIVCGDESRYLAELSRCPRHHVDNLIAGRAMAIQALAQLPREHVREIFIVSDLVIDTQKEIDSVYKRLARSKALTPRYANPERPAASEARRPRAWTGYCFNCWQLQSVCHHDATNCTNPTIPKPDAIEPPIGWNPNYKPASPGNGTRRSQ